ncbi:MAG: sulfite exporter TauE/SafE family protein, partial [Pseudomonadota bacterium]|nr:sulfite exporter TauE/SafE family protein [Pseudomonadota bacterium]
MISFDPMLGFALGAVFVGGLFRGFAGIGAALIIVPALTLVYSPVTAVVLMSLIEIPGALQLARTAVREADWRSLAPLCIAAAVTIPLGAWMLAILDADIVRRSIAGMVVLFGAVIATRWRYKGEVTKA